VTGTGSVVACPIARNAPVVASTAKAAMLLLFAARLPT